jgi:CDP-6-deoxy-D-xylo-4-hexulose-3-dehydrase
MCVGIERKRVMDFFESLNIETRTIFSGNILRHPAYKGTGEQVGDLTNSNEVMEKGMFISNHPSLTNIQIDFIEKAVKELCS